MNLISNTCIGACLYNCLQEKYKNPFCWNFIDFSSMYFLIANYENVNFNNYELVKDTDWNFSLIIDNELKVNYVHYKFDPTKSEIVTKGADVYYNKIWEYIILKYEERLARMIEEPIFVIGSIHPRHWYTKDNIYKICKLCRKKKYKLIIANDNIDLSEEFPEFIFIKTKYTEKDFANGPFTSKEIYSKVKDYIKG